MPAGRLLPSGGSIWPTTQQENEPVPLLRGQGRGYIDGAPDVIAQTLGSQLLAGGEQVRVIGGPGSGQRGDSRSFYSPRGHFGSRQA